LPDIRESWSGKAAVVAVIAAAKAVCMLLPLMLLESAAFCGFYFQTKVAVPFEPASMPSETQAAASATNNFL